MTHQSNIISQKRITSTQFCFVLTLCTLVLPWFCVNPAIQSPCRGIHFLGYFFMPLLIIGIYLFTPIRNSFLTIVVELCCAAYIVLMILAIGHYYEFWNMSGGWNWIEGWHAIRPGFWISATCFLLFFAKFQYDLVRTKKNF